MNSSLIEKFWTDFCNNHGISKSSHYEAYSFGDPESADYIADLVKNGIKTATSSALELYEENERIPQVDDYNVILDSQNLPICVTQTKVVEIVPLIKLWLNMHIMKAKEIVHMNIGIMRMLSFLMQNLNLLTKFLQILRQLFVKFSNS